MALNSAVVPGNLDIWPLCNLLEDCDSLPRSPNLVYPVVSKVMHQDLVYPFH